MGSTEQLFVIILPITVSGDIDIPVHPVQSNKLCNKYPLTTSSTFVLIKV